MASYAEPKMNLTIQIAKCIGSGYLRLIVWTSSKKYLLTWHCWRQPGEFQNTVRTDRFLNPKYVHFHHTPEEKMKMF